MEQDDRRHDDPDALGASEKMSGAPRGGSEAFDARRAIVRLAQTLTRVRVPSGEIGDARRRVEERVFAHVARGKSRWASRRRRRRIGMALALAAISTVVWVSALAGSALPSSPLYGVKRGEEWLAYQTAWSDARRGDVLLLSANRRLEEAQRIASEQEDAAVGLALELRDNLLEAISIYQTMSVVRSPTKDVSALEAGLTRMISDQTTAAQAAEAVGRQLLAETLRENLRLAWQALSSRHLANVSEAA